MMNRSKKFNYKTMRKFLKLLCVFAAAMIAPGILVAQDFNCGTEITEAHKNFMRTIKPRLMNVPVRCLNKTVSISAYITLDSLGNRNLTQAQIDNAIIDLNKYFAPICLQFKICKTVIIANFNYDEMDKIKEEDEMTTIYQNDSTINMYFVTAITGSPSTPAGYAYMPGGKDVIVIQKSAVPDKKTIAHEVGHYFGLMHTFETSMGSELVNGSNCEMAGDMFCDTDADPKGTVDGSCKYTGSSKDAMNEFYAPPIGNIMSYYPASCKCGFTTEQYDFMAYVYMNARNYLW